jgi:hypothetical protein
VAVTNHWVGFAACRISAAPEKYAFFWFDSRDEDNLQWTKQQISDYIDKRHLEKIKKKDPFQWKAFHIWSHKASREDITTASKMLPLVFMGKMSFFDHSFTQFFLTKYENHWRVTLLFPMCAMTGEREKEVLEHLLNNFGELKSFIGEFFYYFQLLEYLNADNLRTLFVLYLECEGVLTRCLKYLK